MGFFIVLVAISLISYGVGAGLRASWFRRNSIPTDGIVVDNELDGTNRRAFYPIVEFKVKSGRKQRFRSSFGARPPLYNSGDVVPVRYMPNDPERARIERPWQIWWDAAGLTGLGLATLAVGMRFLGII